MNRHRTSSSSRVGMVSVLAAWVLLPSSQAAVVYSENFDGLTSLPASVNVVNNTNAVSSLSTSEGNPAPSLQLLDTSTSVGTSASVTGNNWSAFNTSTDVDNIFQVSFDWNVASFLSTAASTLRFNISLGGNTPTTVSIGIGHATVNSVDTNFFYAAGGTSGASPSASNAIGWDGASWASGFNLGAYDSVTAANNGTDGDYYRFTLSYLDQATTAELSVVNLSNLSETATYTITGLTATSVSNTSGRYIQGLTGYSGVGEAYLDNLVVATVPEPASLSLALGAGMLAIVVRRRRTR